MAWTEDLLTRLRAGSTSAGARWAWYERQRGWKDQRSGVINLDDDGRQYSHDGANPLALPDVVIDLFGPSGSAVETLAAEVMAIFETDGVVAGSTRFGMGFVRNGRTIGPDDMPDGARVFRRRMLIQFSVEGA